MKQKNTDDWLKVVHEDKQGLMLLEDSFARENVFCTLTQMRPDSGRDGRFIDSIVKGSQKELCTLVAALLENIHAF